MTKDDFEDMQDVQEAIDALHEALAALKAAGRAGAGRAERERFVFKIGFARGRLSRVSERIYAGPETSDGQAG
jgi:hypothetical protein